MRALPFDAVLCDIDGVLRLWDPDAMPGLDRAYGLAPGTLASAAFAPERLRLAVTGVLTDEAWRRSVAEALTDACGSAERARTMTTEWTALAGRVNDEILTLLTDVRRHAPVVLVSNATNRLEDDLAALGLSDAVDAVVNTARIGVAKPDAAVYALAAERAGAAVERCLFIDDTLANVHAAQEVGMIGHHYRNADALRRALASG
jgi:putative hydrolase of the HAD superfamily